MPKININSNTYTYTFTRTDAIQAQVRIALRRSIDNISDETLERVFDQGIKKKYIKRIDVYALDNYNLCHAQLKLEIDWGKYNFHIKAGHHEISTTNNLLKNASYEIDEVTKLFKNFKDTYQLNTIWQITWASNINVDLARTELGTKKTCPPKWRKSDVVVSSSLSELEELKIGFYLEK